MKKLLIFLFGGLIVYSCNSRPKKTWEEIQKEEEEYYEKLIAKEDSIKNAKHNEIEKKLSKTESGRILGDIVLGMSKKEFEIALQKFDKEVGRIDIDGTTFGVLRNAYNISPVFKDGKLVKVALVAGYSSSIKLPSKGGDISDMEIRDPGKKIKNNIYRHLYAKYGDADSISKLNRTASATDFDYARWEYSFKIIEISEELASVSRGYSGSIDDYRHVYIIFSDPQTFKRNEYVADSIRNEQLRQQREQKAKEKAYSEQL